MVNTGWYDPPCLWVVVAPKPRETRSEHQWTRSETESKTHTRGSSKRTENSSEKIQECPRTGFVRQLGAFGFGRRKLAGAVLFVGLLLFHLGLFSLCRRSLGRRR